MVDGRKKNHRAYREYLREKYQEGVMRSIVRTCTTLSVSARNGTTVYDADSTARGAIDYANVADEILGMVKSSALSEVQEEKPVRESYFRPAEHQNNS